MFSTPTICNKLLQTALQPANVPTWTDRHRMILISKSSHTFSAHSYRKRLPIAEVFAVTSIPFGKRSKLAFGTSEGSRLSKILTAICKPKQSLPLSLSLSLSLSVCNSNQIFEGTDKDGKAFTFYVSCFRVSAAGQHNSLNLSQLGSTTTQGKQATSTFTLKPVTGKS